MSGWGRAVNKPSVAILGLGKEGRAVLKFLKQNHPNIKPVILDRKRDPDYLSYLKEFDIIYRSPGVWLNLPEIKQAKKAGVKFSSVTNLFFEKSKGRIIGVTGTKGKGTTSTLIYRIFKNAGFDAYLGGNIGNAAINILPQLKKNSITVLELSSFQLQDLQFSPNIAVVLDIFPDHLDIHQSFIEYWKAKGNIAAHQKRGDAVFYSSDNKYSKLIALKSRGKKFAVSPRNPSFELRLPGFHNLKNAAMAAAVTSCLGVPIPIIQETIKKFRGLPYRLQLVKERDGTRWYNDSASTNPHTTAAAIKAFPNKPKILIMGGKDKNLDYKPVKSVLLQEKVELVILYGENKAKIKKAFGERLSMRFAKSLGGAVKLASQAAL
ncbi:MAG: UDP-N-acetylmuramoyl-L-alanine--D-glutamate ligase, partial [Candidatus Colwellbacteria bacterium]|nr:UDP-N-acetylmuramoyl-L-alanine--D-glutamate ligase [Candidatus Colwellbacteria bacterium]